MKTTDDFKRNVDSIRYYASEVKKSARSQFNYDLEQYDMTTSQGQSRLHLLAAVGQMAETIDLCCDSIQFNIDVASRAGLEKKETVSNEVA